MTVDELLAAGRLATAVYSAVTKLAKYRGAARSIRSTTVVRGRYGTIKWKCEHCGVSGAVRPGSDNLTRMCLLSFVRRHLRCEAS